MCRSCLFRGRLAFPLYDILHTVQDNLQVDLRDGYPKYFKDLALVHLMSHYPAPFPASESEYRIGATKDLREPDLEQAALSRTAELEMVAFDANSPESQVLQGWLMNDRFLMRGMFGIPYEFLWANPYQPGLSYYHVPLDLDEATVFFGRKLSRVKLPEKEVNDAFIVGVEPNRAYLVEIDDREMWEVRSDPGGILYFPGLGSGVGVRFGVGLAH